MLNVTLDMGGQRYWPFPPVDEVNVPAARVLCLPFGRTLYMSDSFALPRYVAANGMRSILYSGMYILVFANCLIVCTEGTNQASGCPRSSSFCCKRVYRVRTTPT